MDKDRIKLLIDKYNLQQISDAELKDIEQLIEIGQIDLNDLHALKPFDDKVQNQSFPSPSMELDNTFYSMLAAEKRSVAKTSRQSLFSWSLFAPKLALASIALIIGIGIGYMFRQPQQASDNSQMAVLSQQVTDLKEMMMLSLLEKESASERLKAVSLTQDLQGPSEKVTQALVQTLNHDENVNVRLAALDALKPYVKHSSVREALIRSIAEQQSPLVQVALAELMVQLQEKSSVKELEKILQSERTPEDVKKKIKQSLEVLI